MAERKAWIPPTAAIQRLREQMLRGLTLPLDTGMLRASLTPAPDPPQSRPRALSELPPQRRRYGPGASPHAARRCVQPACLRVLAPGDWQSTTGCTYCNG